MHEGLAQTTQQPRRPVMPGRVVGWALLLISIISLGGCSDDPAERTVQRLEALVQLLESNKGDPEALMSELEAFVEVNREPWQRDKEAYEAMDVDRRSRLAAKHDRALREAMLHLIDVSAEIQDRLRDDPAKLARYLELMDMLRAR